ncbi:MAG: MoaD/ThiS family protein [Lentisphaerales bacterium]|nr:MoaD/ThiS family protein [Lentisphaerales bacterium]
MEIKVKYFAALRDERGLDEEVISGEYANAAEVYTYLKTGNGLSLCKSKLKVAINDEFADWETPLSEGDSIVFIPPVAGG